MAREPLPQWLVAVFAGAAIGLAGAVTAYHARPVGGAAPLAPATERRHAPLSTPALLETRSLMVSGTADIGSSLAAIGLSADQVAAALPHILPRLSGRTGDLKLDVALAPAPHGPRLQTLSASYADGFGIQLQAAGGDAFSVIPLSTHLETQLAVVRGVLDGESFYTSAVAAGVNDVLVGDFANAFRYDFDLQREVAKGDAFEAGYEQRVNDSGQPVGLPTLVYASLKTAAKARALYRFAPPGAREAEWFDAGGHSARRSLMRTPVEAARISSGFGFRLHPILGFMKLHKGVDFAAPIGTPIFAAGDGVVLFAGPKGPNGNFVKLHHDNGWETLYLHMNRIWPGIAPGARVTQGQQIGEVGQTGRATGPHLHYEVHINGQAVNPMAIDTGTGRVLRGAELAAFDAVRDRIDARRGVRPIPASGSEPATGPSPSPAPRSSPSLH